MPVNFGRGLRDVITTEGDIVIGGASGVETRLAVGPVGGRIRRKSGQNTWSTDVQEHANVRDYGAVGDNVADDTAAFIAAIAAAKEIFAPEGTYRLTSWVPLLSGRRLYGVGPDSILFNDKTNATIDKRACLLIGNHHPALMSGQTSYVLNNIAYGDPTVTATTAGDAGNFSAGQLVIVGSNTNLSGVPRHAQLNKVTSAVAGTGVITLVDPIEATITDARIWSISGVDASTGNTPITAVENVTVENLGFKGRSAFATKGAIFGGILRNLFMHDVHSFIGAGNMMTHVLVENVGGQYSGQLIQTAFNSYNVIFRNIEGRFRPPAGLQSGESMVLPINIGEQSYRVLLDDVQCQIDSRYTPATELAQIKGSKITLRKCDFRHAGAAGSLGVNVIDNAYTGFWHEDIVFEDCRLAAPGKASIVIVGGASAVTENPREVHFRGGELTDGGTTRSVWFRAGRGFSCSMADRTTTGFQVSTTAKYPNLNGYRRTV